jgi:hypothetical protein
MNSFHSEDLIHKKKRWTRRPGFWVALISLFLLSIPPFIRVYDEIQLWGVLRDFAGQIRKIRYLSLKSDQAHSAVISLNGDSRRYAIYENCGEKKTEIEKRTLGERRGFEAEFEGDGLSGEVIKSYEICYEPSVGYSVDGEIIELEKSIHIQSPKNTKLTGFVVLVDKTGRLDVGLQ